MKKRWVSLLLAIILSVAVMPAFSVFAEQNFYYYVEQTYENLEVTNEFGANPEGLGVSFLSENSKIKVVDSDLALLGKRSLAISECDMRWNEISLSDEKMYIGFTVRADAEFNNELKLSFDTLQPSVNQPKKESLVALSLTRESGKIILKDCKGNLLTELEAKTRYVIYCEFSRGSDSYSVFVNDSLKAENCNSGIKIYSIENMQMQVKSLAKEGSYGSSVTNKQYVLVDNISVYAKGKVYPQKYSAQQSGKIPEIKLPQKKENKTIRVFVNTTEIAMANEPVLQKNTVYIDVEQLARCLSMTLKEDTANKKFVLSNENVKVEAVIGSKTIKINEKHYDIANAPEKLNGVIMVTPNFLSEVLNAKVWWDDKSNMVVVTLGERKADDVLRVVGGKLYMNGEPYYEISIDKNNMFNQILSNMINSEVENATLEAEATLSKLSMEGIKSIRVSVFSNELANFIYDESEQEIYFKAMDRFFDLCEKYDIKVIASLGIDEAYIMKKDSLSGEGFVAGTENSVDLIVDSNSESRKNLYNYLEKFISGYKDRKSVLMWELAKELNLEADVGNSVNRPMYSLLQLSKFYGDCADKIRQFDNVHIISSGDGILRNDQWSSFEDVMNGETVRAKTDSKEETLKALAMINEKLDVVSIRTNEYNDLYQYMEYSEKLNKALYNGATGIVTSQEKVDFYSNVNIYLNSVKEIGLQISYFSVSGLNDTEMAQLVSETNKQLNEKYCINSAENENTTDAWENPFFQVVDSSKITDGMEFVVMASFKSRFMRFCILSGVTVMASLVCVILLTREKLKRKRTEDFV